MLKKPDFKSYTSIWLLGAFFSVLLALLLWLPAFAQLPAGLNRDEAALGYNAYSLLKTGKDEWGKSWPISVTSFGDQKLPGYIYTLIPLIALFDLEVWVIRLPSLLAGLVVVVNLGLIALRLSQMAKLKKETQLTVSILSMLLSAISPWQMHFSRVAYETHLAMAFFLSGLTLFLFALNNRSQLKQQMFLIFSGFWLSASMLTYHSYQIFLPLFLLILLTIFFKPIKKLDRTGLFTGVAIGLIAIFILFSGGVMSANQVKGNGLNPYTQDNLTNDVLLYRPLINIPNSIERIGYNKLFSFTKLFSQNYLSTFSGRFFFAHGSGHGDHNPGNGSNLHLFTAPFILVGILALWDRRKEKPAQLLIAWLLLALVPSSMTINPLLEVRIATVFPVMDLLSAIGILYLLNFVKNKAQIILIIVLTFTAIISSHQMFIFYTKITPKTAVDNTPYHDLATVLYKYQNQTDFVLTQSPTSSPYIWYLVVNKIDPKIAQHAKHFLPTEEGFIHVEQIDNVFFKNINWEELEKQADDHSFTLVIKPEEFPREKWTDHRFKKLEEIKNKKGKVIYEVFRYE